MSQQINLFNPIFRKQQKYFSSVTMAQALGIICLACALLAVNASWRMRQLAAQVAATDAQLQARQTRLAAFKAQFPARQKSPTLAGEMAAAQSELALLEQASGMLEHGSFGDTRGFSTYFRAFARQSVDGLWLTGLTIDGGGTQLAVQGNALQPDLVPKYMRRL
ncbi:MAG: PilN domain-containing protein, partial [Massilia sp.]